MSLLSVSQDILTISNAVIDYNTALEVFFLGFFFIFTTAVEGDTLHL